MNRRLLVERIAYDTILFATVSFLICLLGPMTIQTLLFCAAGWIGVDVFKLAVNRD